MATIYVVSWFRRDPAPDPRPRYWTGWARGLTAFTNRVEAEIEAVRQEDLARSNAAAPRELAISHVHATAYELAGRPSLDLVVNLVANPPQGDPMPTGGDWFSRATVFRAWCGLVEARTLEAEDLDG